MPIGVRMKVLTSTRQPCGISISRLRGIMSTEINLQSLGALVSRNPAQASTGQMNLRVDSIQEAAAREAEIRGKSMASQGAAAKGDSTGKSTTETKVAPPAAVMALETTPPESPEVQTPTAPGLQEFLEAIAPLEGSEASDFLVHLSRRLPVVIGRLQLSEGIDAVKDLKNINGSRWALTLLARGVEPEALAAIVTSECWFPATCQDGIGLLDHFCDSGILRFRDVRRIERLARDRRSPFWREAVESGLLDEVAYVNAVSTLTGVERAGGTPRFTRPVLEVLPIEWIQRFDLAPLRRSKNVTQIAFAGVPSDRLQAAIAAAARGKITFRLATRAEVDSWRSQWLERWTEEFGQVEPEEPPREGLKAILKSLRVESGTSGVVVLAATAGGRCQDPRAKSSP